MTHEHGISKAGNRCMRAMAIQIAWGWLTYQRESALTQWYLRRFAHGDPSARKIGIVAVARRFANRAIERLVASRAMAAVPIDTRLDVNATGLRSVAEIESLIARMDVVLTTRLHGLVLAIKNGVPAVVVDPIGKGAKVLRQAKALGWKVVFTADDLSDVALTEAFEWALTEDARVAASNCRERGVGRLQEARDRFLSAFAGCDSAVEA